MMLGVNLNEDQIERADALARLLTTRYGIKVSRSAVIGRAIDALFLAECPTDKTNDVNAGHPIETAA
jgi:hypothetical protein